MTRGLDVMDVLLGRGDGSGHLGKAVSRGAYAALLAVYGERIIAVDKHQLFVGLKLLVLNRLYESLEKQWVIHDGRSRALLLILRKLWTQVIAIPSSILW